MTETFDIPIENMPRLEEKFKKLNRKAKKLGFPEVFFMRIQDVYKTFKDDGMEYTRHWVRIVVVGETPKIDGWKFLATLDHKSIPGSVLVKTVPGADIPQHFHESDTTCDHCNHKRIRNKTFILENEGKFKRVGSTCVKDFIGHDPKKIAAYMECLFDATDMDEFMGGSYTPEYPTKQVLAITAAVINVYGWTSKTVAEENDLASTSMIVTECICSNGHEADKLRAECPVTKEHYTHVEKAIDWVCEQDESSDYMINIKKIIPSSIYKLISDPITLAVW